MSTCATQMLKISNITLFSGGSGENGFGSCQKGRTALASDLGVNFLNTGNNRLKNL